MTRRMIDDSMWSNERFAEMPMGARLLQIGVINHADDQGRMKANPVYLRAQIFPYDDIAPGQIQEWLNIMAANNTIILYEADGRVYLQLTNWWKYQALQYAQPSQFPRPDGWKDRIRKTLTKGFIVTCNWLKVNGEPLEDTCDMDGNALPGRKPRSEPTPDSGTNDTPENTEENAGDSGEHSGESSAKGTNKLNRTKLNSTKLNSKEEEEKVNSVRQPSGASNGKAPSAPRGSAQRTYGKVTHYDPRQVDKDGLLPKGSGETQIEIWRESFMWTPTAAQIADMNEKATDLDKWRKVTADCAVKGFRSYPNVMDVYMNGWKDKPAPAATERKPKKVRIFNQYTGQYEEKVGL